MSTRLRDITTESDLARVPTRDLDPDPANGLKNENEQRGEIRNQGPVRQQPITVQMQDANQGLLSRFAPDTNVGNVQGGPPAVFDPRIGAGILTGDVTLADAPLLGRFIGQDEMQLEQELDLGPAPPLAGPAGVGVATAGKTLSRIGGGIKSIPRAARGISERLRITGQRGQQQLSRPLEVAQEAVQRGQQAAGRIRAPQGVTGPPQRPGDILARQPVGGGGGGGVGPEMMRISRLQDIGMQQRRLERLRAAQEAQVAATQRAGQVQQTGLTALGLGGAQERLEQAQQSGLTQFEGPPGVMEDLTVPAQPGLSRLQQAQQQEFQQLPRPELTGFGAEISRPDIRQFDPTIQRQFGGLQQTPLQRPGVTPGLEQRQLSLLGQPQLNIQRPIQTPQFPPITTTIPQPQVPPPQTPRIGIPPGPPLQIPGVPPLPVPFGAGGGGAPRGFGRRGFPFGRIREFSPAFPGTSFRVLPDGTVVLDVDPGTSPQRTGDNPPRDPNTGRFIKQQ